MEDLQPLMVLEASDVEYVMDVQQEALCTNSGIEQREDD